MEQPSRSLVNWTQAIYALHAFSLLTGIVGAATVVGAFLTGWPSIIAVILNYVKRSEVRGTWLEIGETSDGVPEPSIRQMGIPHGHPRVGVA